MHVRWQLCLSTVLVAAAALGGCDDGPPPSSHPIKAEPTAAATGTGAAAKPTGSAAAPAGPVQLDPSDLGFFKPLPERFESEMNPITEDKVALGRMLYYENRFSINQDLSCNSCHDLEKYGVDNEATSFGHKKQRGSRNSPTVYNAAGHIAQFWDGRAQTIEDQAKGPILNPVEMAMPNAEYVLKVLKSIPEYVKLFKKVFPNDKEAVTYDNVAKAIGAFERQLVTPSRWDKFLKGDQSALTEPEKAGFALFAKLGCPTCHNGAAVGGAQFQKLGLVKPYPDQSDLGRFEHTKSESDKMVFRVPTLRNIEKTAPYFHKGQVATLEEAVKLMAFHQLGKELNDAEIASIVTWLKTLTGEIPRDYIKKPELPPSTDKTPKPKAD
ncbi:MAG: cytochrome-c peroxidase [Polyangiaceae bacterium]|nr:cytochrome-c peroxidase [Polyangiaceae bacterium]